MIAMGPPPAQVRFIGEGKDPRAIRLNGSLRPWCNSKPSILMSCPVARGPGSRDDGSACRIRTRFAAAAAPARSSGPETPPIRFLARLLRSFQPQGIMQFNAQHLHAPTKADHHPAPIGVLDDFPRHAERWRASRSRRVCLLPGRITASGRPRGSPGCFQTSRRLIPLPGDPNRRNCSTMADAAPPHPGPPGFAGPSLQQIKGILRREQLLQPGHHPQHRQPCISFQPAPSLIERVPVARGNG